MVLEANEGIAGVRRQVELNDRATRRREVGQ